MNEDQKNAGDEPLDSLVGCTKVLLALPSGFCLLGWIYIALVTFGWYGFPNTIPDAFALFYPPVYLSAAIYCCWVHVPVRALITSAVLLNLPLIGLLVYLAIKGVGFNLGIGACLTFFVLWILLCAARVQADMAGT